MANPSIRKITGQSRPSVHLGNGRKHIISYFARKDQHLKIEEEDDENATSSNKRLMKTCEIKELRDVKDVDDNIDNILKQNEGHRV